MSVAEKIANLRAWLAHGSMLKPYVEGAACVLDEIAAAHADLLAVNADLLAACEALLAVIRDPGPAAGMRLVGIVSDGRTYAALDAARAAAAAARGA